ncbi:MAG: hypothetical protein HY298_01840 [Verrucomicrobia bacterium]|nr:hypothetical protein [Verrucomicrobiota bacterium]
MKTTRCFHGGTVALALLLCAANAVGEERKSSDTTKEPTKIIDQDRDGSVTLLAKDATTHGTTIRYEPQPHKNTIGYWTKKEDWVSWDFKLHTLGKFTLELTQACGKGSGGSDYTVTIGNRTLTDRVPDTGAFTNFVNRKIGTVKLDKPGNYTVSVKPLTKPGLAVMDLRAIKLIPEKTDR